MGDNSANNCGIHVLSMTTILEIVQRAEISALKDAEALGIQVSGDWRKITGLNTLESKIFL